MSTRATNSPDPATTPMASGASAGSVFRRPTLMPVVPCSDGYSFNPKRRAASLRSSAIARFRRYWDARHTHPRKAQCREWCRQEISTMRKYSPCKQNSERSDAI